MTRPMGLSIRLVGIHINLEISRPLRRSCPFLWLRRSSSGKSFASSSYTRPSAVDCCRLYAYCSTMSTSQGNSWSK